jgi:hypothetical protein
LRSSSSAVSCAAPSTPSPPARDTATTTRSLCEKASSGCSMPSISVIAVRIARRYARAGGRYDWPKR